MTSPRTPVLVGYGQVNQHDENPDVEPIDLMAAAARAAADPRVLEAVDSVRIVNLLSWRYRDPGLLLAQQIRADRRGHPVHGRRRQRAADTGEPGVPGHPGRTRRPRPHRRCRNMPHPNASARQRHQAELDECRTSRCRSPQAPTRTFRWSALQSSASTWIGPRTSTRCSSRRCGSRRGSRTDAHRRRIGELWARFSEVAQANPHAWSRRALSGRGDLATQPRQPDDQLAVHQADELEQHGRPGRGPHPDVGREGHPSADPHRPLGFPVRGHRCARHLRDR